MFNTQIGPFSEERSNRIVRSNLNLHEKADPARMPGLLLTRRCDVQKTKATLRGRGEGRIVATDEKERLVSCPETNKLQPRRRLPAHSNTVAAECKKRGQCCRGQLTGGKLQVAGGRALATCHLPPATCNLYGLQVIFSKNHTGSTGASTILRTSEPSARMA